jgi:hypothetical protein
MKKYINQASWAPSIRLAIKLIRKEIRIADKTFLSSKGWFLKVS